ncbi:hypothetical protein [Mucilaginibacter sp. 3215]|uniref:hypothetical protein n=1 Tax=Mucilaginibacter sp. 3215 TaxID=3373912 RepID=UPI003D1B9FC4
MEPENLSKCTNCGAPLVQDAAKKLKCPYCGSDYLTPSAEQEITAPARRQDIPVSQAEPQNNNGGYFVALLVVGMVIIGGALIANNNAPGDVKYADSLVTDTTRNDTTVAESPKKDENPYKPILDALSGIQIDSQTFKKLYRKAYRKADKFTGNIEIADQSSPRYVNINGFYIYIMNDSSGPTLRFATQYVSNDWLFINEMIINADGENSTLTPEFKRDSGDGSIWEWCDMSVPDENIPMLVKIAGAKKVSLRYSGDKYYQVVKVTAKQQAAIKRELQLYKGLLLGYKGH